jgi:epoxyqueuosine reductase
MGVQRINSRLVRDLAAQCGFALAGVAAPRPVPDFARFRDWIDRGLAGEMRYLTDHRAEVRSNPEMLLPGVRSIICVGLLYDGPEPYSTEFSDPERAWISRYAWGEDYHGVIRAKLERLAGKLRGITDFQWRSCVDTAPLLERSFAQQAGLGWIGRNTCLINQRLGSWFFLGELLTTLDLPPDVPAPDRCGTCTRCIDACPTKAIVPCENGKFELDARLCISYFTIELRTAIPEANRAAMGSNVFGCDICQDVCPWNSKSKPSKSKPAERAPAALFAPPLERMAQLTEEEFRQLFQGTAVTRTKYNGFLRNVAIAMGNSGLGKFRPPLEKLAVSEDPLVAEYARWALGRLS